ncbi:tyrosine-protein kinase family protein [Anaeromicropila populeti]|uniref:CobQ/CobB/MinD/ParA nucleotide binding domain-containing protein n=1 Tax=Anaeromicropila populeti TaxID=37658 RepID=A0A1I6JVL9_9FIRM|nr:AAA family ATPase [Anaeromicropila populeti]SFR83044.1 CobQ/CobB/MinD/ParA nucleotide binding domain-containing protein [Anaeromicropila populeti]
MMLHFDEVKPRIIDFIKALEDKESIFYIIRDVFGRITVYVEGKDELEELNQKILQELGKEWLNGVVTIEKSHMLYEVIAASVKKVPGTSQIFFGERPLVKKNWLKRKMVRPEIQAKVITFYSYKGGVGRTTVLALTALQMVRQGKRVVVMDLDLEAPGVSTILKPKNNKYPLYGTADFLIEVHNAGRGQEQINMEEYLYSVQNDRLAGTKGGELLVLQAVNGAEKNPFSYFEKISRIDLGTPQYETEDNGIRKLLEIIDQKYSPDYIFLDSRSGIHDIGGTALTQYSDNAVLVFYGNQQNMFGMQFVLSRLIEEKVSFMLVNSTMPAADREGEIEKEYYVECAYEYLIQNGYYDNKNLPDISDENADHFPISIPYMKEAVLLDSEEKMEYLLSWKEDENPYFKLAEKLLLI